MTYSSYILFYTMYISGRGKIIFHMKQANLIPKLTLEMQIVMCNLRATFCLLKTNKMDPGTLKIILQ